eukprot:1142556-Pelagomonas_calceolata.AAC.2
MLASARTTFFEQQGDWTAQETCYYDGAQNHCMQLSEGGLVCPETVQKLIRYWFERLANCLNGVPSS